MEGITLIQKGDVEYERTSARPGERVWIRINSPDGKSSADIGILSNSEGISIDVWAPDSAGQCSPADGPVIAPWLLWSDIEEVHDEDIVDNQE
jgi:hypothetical protein